jgi:hypothetical protein
MSTSGGLCPRLRAMLDIHSIYCYKLQTRVTQSLVEMLYDQGDIHRRKALRPNNVGGSM